MTEKQQLESRMNRQLANEDRQDALQLSGKETREDLTELLGERGLEL